MFKAKIQRFWGWNPRWNRPIKSSNWSQRVESPRWSSAAEAFRESEFATKMLGVLSTQPKIVILYVVWLYMVLYGFIWFYMVLYGFIWFSGCLPCLLFFYTYRFIYVLEASWGMI